MRLASAFLCFVTLCLGADYSGPRPPKPDLPYLLHASSLVETEAAEAKEQQKKDDTTYVIAGDSSPAKTPLAEPIFVIASDKLVPERLELYRLEVKNGNREITMNQKKKRGPRPFHILVTRLADHLYRVDVSEMLDAGQYSLSPSDSNRVFCFEVY